MNLQEKLNQVFGGQVSDFKFDILDHELCFNVLLIENDSKKDFSFKFGNVSSFFIEDENAEKFNNFFWEKAEISSFYYVPDEKLEIAINSNIGQEFHTPIKYNIFFEIWECVIFLKAEKLILNGEVYDLKSP